MKGYEPRLVCKKDKELSSKNVSAFLELGVREKVCECEDSCKKQDE